VALVDLLVIFIAYLCGSISTGAILARQAGVDIRRSGSGNIGATNVARTAGGKAGILTLLGDMAKGFLPVMGARFLGFSEITLAAMASAAFLGHLYPIFLKFSGGKGVATALGVFLGLTPQAMVIPLAFFLVTFVWSRIVSLASMVAAVVTPVVVFLWPYPKIYALSCLAVSLLILIRHRENIQRLLRGEEKKFQLARP
jgi:glycerol-3-phosphate acyltransferase PlsY